MKRKNLLDVISLVRGNCKISADPDSCWEWFEPLPIARHRYAYIELPDGQQIRIHRMAAWAHDHFPGELRDYPDVHHICANVNCVKPHHLKPMPARANLAEGRAREHLALRAEHLDAAIQSASGLGSTRIPSVMSGKDRRQQVRRQQAEEIRALTKVKGWQVRDACLHVGMSEDSYRRAVASHHPEWEKRSLTDFELAVLARDEVHLRTHVEKHSTATMNKSNCRPWGKSTRDGFASWGSHPRQWYMHRIAVWAARGCPSDLALLPTLYRNAQICQFQHCVNPNHWDPVTDFLPTVLPRMVSSTLAKIRRKMVELAQLDPNHSMLVDGWDAYLPTDFREEMRR